MVGKRDWILPLGDIDRFLDKGSNWHKTSL
jgi:hypothetical protein